MPVWHVSISLVRRGERAPVPRRLERAAVALLRGVGGITEWWLWNAPGRIGHLRVAVTLQEYQQIPRGVAVADAGPSGPPRRRTR